MNSLSKIDKLTWFDSIKTKLETWSANTFFLFSFYFCKSADYLKIIVIMDIIVRFMSIIMIKRVFWETMKRPVDGCVKLVITKGLRFVP